MAKKQQRIKRIEMEASREKWLGKSGSVVLNSGIVYEVTAKALVEGALHCEDALRLKHHFPLTDIYEIILYFPVAEHAQTSAN